MAMLGRYAWVLGIVALSLGCSDDSPPSSGAAGGAGGSGLTGGGAGASSGGSSVGMAGGVANAGGTSAGSGGAGGAGTSGSSSASGGGSGGTPSGGAGGNGAGAGPVPSEVEIASGQKAPTGIAIDSESVYWSNNEAGSIVKCPLSGCAGNEPTVLASNVGKPMGLALGADAFYWMAPPVDESSKIAQVLHCPLSGCTGVPEKLFEFEVRNKAVDVHVAGDTLYIAAWPFVGSCPTSGCTSFTEFVRTPSVGIDSNETSLFIANFGGVTRCSLDGCKDPVSLTSAEATLGLAIDSEHVYFAQYNYFGSTPSAPTTIARCPLSGCGDDPPELIKSGDFGPFGVAVNDDRIFYTDVVEGRVVSLEKPD